MAIHNIIGKEGEKWALDYLLAKGNTLVAQNWRYRKLEVDLIMQEEDTLVFVEVKTRSGHSHAMPFEAVDERKIRNLVSAAERYIQKRAWQGHVRFDIISITIAPYSKTPEILHIQDAFYPPLF